MSKVVVVNGAACTGFGEETMRKLISQGIKVIGFYFPEDSLNAQKLKKEFSKDCLNLVEIKAYDKESVMEAVYSIDQEIDGFVNAHFVFEMDDIDAFDYSIAEKVFFANYHMPLLMAIELKKKMKDESSVVIVTSTESERGSYGGISYAASKAAMHNAIKSLACNWGTEKIRVNAVAAGWIGGEMDTDGPFEVSMNITPLGRLGRAEEVANVVAFLISCESSFVNAQTIFVDGGYLCVDDIAKYEYEESKKNC